MSPQIQSDYLPLPKIEDVFPYIHADPTSLPTSSDPFTITERTGYLPLRAPLTNLPAPFKHLQILVEDMPIKKLDGKAGLLSAYNLGPTIEKGFLVDMTEEVDKLSSNLAEVTAIFRDYTFLASAYLLEPCWQYWNENGKDGYGIGRSRLPACIARPMVRCAEILDIPPFMSYAASYALYNYTFADNQMNDPFSSYSNLRLIRGFEHGLDPASSEAGFILTHVDMVRQTGPLIEGVVQLLKTIESSTITLDNRDVNNSLQLILTSMSKIEASMEKMWNHSLPKDYISYRTFIFGITSQSMFPDGVVYEGCFDNKPQFWRGESGANDSIIPLLDHLCQIPMPPNPLTTILKDFRQYRPLQHRQFLSYVNSKSTELGTASRLCARLPPNAEEEQVKTVILFLKVLDTVRSFRWRHWLFAREYIIKRSKHPTATGGSPIVTWLPNQLLAVMEYQSQIYKDSGLQDLVDASSSSVSFELQGMLRDAGAMMDDVSDQNGKLGKEVKKYCSERGVTA